jgi:hypothetical protein
MKKKPRKSTAKRPAAKLPRKRKPRQLSLPLGSERKWHRVGFAANSRGIIVGKPETFPAGMAMGESGWPMFNLVMRKPHPRAGQAIEKEIAVKRAQRQRSDAYAARLNRRPKAMRQSDYKLPDDVRAFLLKRYAVDLESEAEWEIMQAAGWPDDNARLHRKVHDILAIAIHAAYMHGCVEGYIEGRVADLEPKRERSREMTQAKRRKRKHCGGQMMTKDERDAAIVAEFPTLRKMLGSIDAQLRLAEKYGLTSREQIGNVIRKAKQNGTA